MIKKLILVVFYGLMFGDLYGSNPIEKTEKFLPGMQEPVPFLVDLTLPDSFVSKGLDPIIEPNLFEGMIWGTEEDVNRYINAQLKSKMRPFYPNGKMIFIAEYSSHSLQSLFEEGFMDISNNLVGFSDIVKRKTFWGPYPIWSLQMKDKKGLPACIAWIGLNYGDMVLVISGIFSEDASTHKNGFQIWEKFINDTRYIGKTPDSVFSEND